MQRSSQPEIPDLKRLCGIDGCKYGWISVFCAENFSNIGFQLAQSWTDLPLDNAIVAVDMPIGLAEIGRRGCEEAARKILKGKASSLFPMPVRAALDFVDYPSANAWSKQNGHGGIVKQAWNLKAKILEVESAKLSNRAAMFESHPELCFAKLADGAFLAPKRTREGSAQRLELLKAQGLTNLERLFDRIPHSQAKPDDILDAAVLLITARRIATGLAQSFPSAPKPNVQGIEMAIWV